MEDAYGAKTPSNQLKRCRDYVRDNPEDADGHRNLGDAYVDTKRYQDAQHAYTQAIQIDSECAKAHLGLGVTDMHLENHREAIVSLNNALNLDPTDCAAYYYLGLCCLKNNQRDKALAYYKTLRDMDEKKAGELFDAIYP